MPFTKKDWNTGEVLTEADIDRIEQGIADAHDNKINLPIYFGQVVGTNPPTLFGGAVGWSAIRVSEGTFQVSYPSGSPMYVACTAFNGLAAMTSTTSTYFVVNTYLLDGTQADRTFSFSCRRWS